VGTGRITSRKSRTFRRYQDFERWGQLVKDFIALSERERNALMDWWNTMETAKPIIRRLMSLITEFRVRPETSHTDGIILFYRAASEVSYGYAGVRGCIRRALSNEYNETLRMNMAMCHSFAEKFSVDAKVLFERVAAQVTDTSSSSLIQRIWYTLGENDYMLNEINKKAILFFDKDNWNTLHNKMKQNSKLNGS